MIVRFADSDSEAVWHRRSSKRIPPELRRTAWKKLAMIDAATTLDDLRFPPGNRLEKLKGDRRGRYRIRINRQWRICFQWKASNAYAVEIVDYHQ